MNKVRAALVLIAMIVPNTSYAMSDDTQGHWAKDVIASWRETAWIGGYPDGTFRPDAPITRAEFVALLSTAAPLVEEQSFDYVDVTIDPWYVQALRKAKAANAISGYPGGVFAPTKPITRAEAASLIGRVKKWKEQPALSDPYTDAASIAEWSKGFVGASVALGVMKGYPDGTFRPMQPITRAEAIIVLHRSMLEGQKPIHIAALGDSLTAGFGDETNIGYVHRLGKELRARTHLPIYVRANFAVVGQKTTDVLEMLEDTEKNMKAHTILKQANIIVMTIGGNDIYRLGEPLDVAVVSARMPTARERVKKILTNVRTINPTAHITYVGLYNPFDASASKLIQQWNDAIAQLVEDKNMTVVSDIFPNDITPYLAWDKYHLNGAGYTRVAEIAADTLSPLLKQSFTMTKSQEMLKSL